MAPSGGSAVVGTGAGAVEQELEREGGGLGRFLAVHAPVVAQRLPRRGHGAQLRRYTAEGDQMGGPFALGSSLPGGGNGVRSASVDAATPDPYVAEIGYVRWVGGVPPARRRTR